MAGGKRFVDLLQVSTAEVIVVSADPNGVVTAPRGSVAYRKDAGSANLKYRNTSAAATGTTWVAA
jgi:hypothetical protein